MGTKMQQKTNENLQKRTYSPAYTALKNLKSLSEIDEKAAGLDEAMLRDISVRVNFNVDGKYYNIDELTLHQALKSGGVENYLRQTYGCGEFEVQIRGETTGGKKGIIVSPKYEILGDPSPKLLRLLSHQQRIRDGFTLNKPSSYQNPPFSYASAHPDPAQSTRGAENKEIEMLKAKLNAMERKSEQNEIIGAFQAENDEIKKQLAGLAQSIEKQSEKKTDSAWKDFIPVATSGLGGLVGVLKDIITDRPSSTDMLKSSASMVKGISEFMSTLKDLNPPPPPPPTSEQTGSGLDAILKAAAPKLIEALSNRAVTPAGTQQPSSATSGAMPMPLVQDPQSPQSGQDGNFPRTQEKLNELSTLISQRVSADAVAEEMVASFNVVISENAFEILPELAQLQTNPQLALDSFLSRFSLEGVEGQSYKTKIMDAIYRQLAGPVSQVDEQESVEV